MTLDDEDICCTICGEELDEELVGKKLPQGVYFCSECNKLFFMKEINVEINFGKEIDKTMREIGLTIDLLF